MKDVLQRSPTQEPKKAKSQTKYERSSVPNLYRHLASGIYYVRARGANSRDTWKSLGTDVFTVAKARVGSEVAKIQAGASHKQVSGFKRIETVVDAAAIYQARVESDTSLKPASIDYRTKINGCLMLWVIG